MGETRGKIWTYDDQSGKRAEKYHAVPVCEKDKARVRYLAQRWMEIAKSQDMQIKKRKWKALNDLKPERPMIVFETFSVSGFVTNDDLKCEHPMLRNVEQTMVYAIRQCEELGDDFVFEDYFRIAWKIYKSDYGVPIVEHHAENSVGYLSNFPIANKEDINLLKQREFSVDWEQSLGLKAILDDIFGDILPVRIGNCDYFMPDVGFTPFNGLNFIGITMDLFKLIGYENMALWSCLDPEVLHGLLRYLCDDRKRFYLWLQQEGVIDYNSGWQASGPSSAGYVSALPPVQMNADAQATLRDCWAWPESQETTTISPAMFNEIFLPYIAEVASMFGLAYYGCCESVTDRIEYIKAALPNLRKVSVSGWNDFYKVAESLGKSYVYSRKPNPTFISGKNPDWAGAEKDVKETWQAAKNGCLEFVVRDVYDVNGDLGTLRKWVDMTKRIIGL